MIGVPVPAPLFRYQMRPPGTASIASPPGSAVAVVDSAGGARLDRGLGAAPAGAGGAVWGRGFDSAPAAAAAATADTTNVKARTGPAPLGTTTCDKVRAAEPGATPVHGPWRGGYGAAATRSPA